MIRISERLLIGEEEIEESFLQAGGPGGQNVNKVASAVQLRFDAAGSPSLDPGMRARLSRIAGRRMTREGVIVITARRFRARERNREDALERLIALLRRAESRPRPRVATRPTAASRWRRRQAKRALAARKRLRQPLAPPLE
jgi:ribosome-associated protein